MQRKANMMLNDWHRRRGTNGGLNNIEKRRVEKLGILSINER